MKEFKGYLSQSETEKKIIRNVFQHGDSAFSSGFVNYGHKLLN